jgi:hypothetical protein
MGMSNAGVRRERDVRRYASHIIRVDGLVRDQRG